MWSVRSKQWDIIRNFPYFIECFLVSLLCRVRSKWFNKLHFQNCLISTCVRKQFITYGKPHKNPSKGAVHWWILEILDRVVINTSTQKPYNTSHESLSKSLNQGLNWQNLLSKGDWISGSVFRKYYQLSIMTPDTLSCLLNH